MGQTYNECGGMNHYAKCCRNKQRNGKVTQRSVHFMNKSQSSRQTINNNSSSEESDSCVWAITTCLIGAIGKVANFIAPMLSILICGLMIPFTIETGAQVNIMDNRTFNKLKFRPILKQTKMKIFAFGQKVPMGLKGEFKSRAMYNGTYKKCVFIVTNGDYGNLIGYKSAVELGVINEISQHGKVNKIRTKTKYEKKDRNEFQQTPENIKKEEDYINKIKNAYPIIFQDRIGELIGFEAELHIDESITPVQGKLRNLPFNIREGSYK